ncbi:hypothetical protein Pelo_8677 [Pelomyxa schiedti]|nr:hypothetical protein Pelo_8677 [Pelomyxa schiedti]
MGTAHTDMVLSISVLVEPALATLAKSPKPSPFILQQPLIARQQAQVLKASFLLHSHLAQLHGLLTPRLHYDLDCLLEYVPSLLNGMMTCVNAQTKMAVAPLLQVIRLGQMLVQGCWEESELMQLPHFNASKLKICRKYGVSTVAQLIRKGPQRKSMYASLGLSEDQQSNIESVLSYIPVKALRITCTFYSGIGPQSLLTPIPDNVVTTLAMVTLVVKCERMVTAGTPSTYHKCSNKDASENQEVDEDSPLSEDSGSEDSSNGDLRAHRPLLRRRGPGTKQARTSAINSLKSKQQKEKMKQQKKVAPPPTPISDAAIDEGTSSSDSEKDSASATSSHQSHKCTASIKMPATPTKSQLLAPFVHAPYFPQHRQEGWLLLLVDKKGVCQSMGKVVVSVTGDRTAEAKLPFQAPKSLGPHQWELLLCCDSYLGCDHRVPLRINVVSPADPTIQPESLVEDDSDDTEEEEEEENEDEDESGSENEKDKYSGSSSSEDDN